MATTFKLKRKTFATAVMVGNQIFNAANHSSNDMKKKTQKYYDQMFGGENANKTLDEIIKRDSKNRVGRFTPVRDLGGKETYKGVNKVATGKQAFEMGQKSVGIKQGMRNTWNNMGTLSKAGTIAAGVTAAGLMARGLFGGKKRKKKDSNKED